MTSVEESQETVKKLNQKLTKWRNKFASLQGIIKEAASTIKQKNEEIESLKKRIREQDSLGSSVVSKVSISQHT